MNVLTCDGFGSMDRNGNPREVQMIRAIRSERGFSLIESMVAFGILAVGMMAVATMITSSMRFDRQSMGKRDGVEIAMRLIEDLRSEAADTDPTATNPGTKDASDAGYGWLGQYYLRWDFYGTDEGGNTFDRTLPPPSTNWTYRVVATVGWGGGAGCSKGSPQNCAYKTQVTNYIIVKKP